jgi:hypothetical protein
MHPYSPSSLWKPPRRSGRYHRREAERLDFKEPAGRRAFGFAVLPIGKLEVISHQRKASAPHVARPEKVLGARG